MSTTFQLKRKKRNMTNANMIIDRTVNRKGNKTIEDIAGITEKI